MHLVVKAQLASLALPVLLVPPEVLVDAVYKALRVVTALLVNKDLMAPLVSKVRKDPLVPRVIRARLEFQAKQVVMAKLEPKAVKVLLESAVPAVIKEPLVVPVQMASRVIKEHKARSACQEMSALLARKVLKAPTERRDLKATLVLQVTMVLLASRAA